MSAIGWSIASLSVILVLLLVIFLSWKKSNKPRSSLGWKKSMTRRRTTPVSVVGENIQNTVEEFEKQIQIAPRAQIVKEKFTAGTAMPSKQIVERSKTFHAFASYNSADELDVKSIYEFLTDNIGLRIWFDKESIEPGDDWMEAMEEGIENSRACLVFYRDEPGVWQKEETKQAMRRRTEDSSFKIIPVLLPGGKDPEPAMPKFLKGTASVDLRAGLFNARALKRLVDAIRGGDIVPIHQVAEDSAISGNLPTGYKADVKKIISLLIGDALYSRHDVCIRELLQNAVDACERLNDSRFGAAASAEIIVRINTEEGYFEVIDNGDGMSPEVFSEYFAVVGRSIRDEENVMERAQGDERTRAHLIGKFGIGFISTYMLAKQILISTTNEGHDQINVEINSITEPFVYHSTSKLRRPPDQNGTSIRVYLKDAFLANGTTPLDITATIQEFCRHVQYIKVFKDGSRVTVKDVWNTEGLEVVDVTNIPFRFELRLGLSQGSKDFFASNAGFLINRSSEQISPEFMPTNVGGEINFYPGVVDLNMARDTVIDNDKSKFVRRLVSKAIKNLLIRLTTDASQKERKLLREILIGYLGVALAYEESTKTPDARPSLDNTESYRVEVDAPPLSSIEAAELLMDVWDVEIENTQVSLREALRMTKQNGRNRVYWAYEVERDLYGVIQESLKKRGFVHVVLDARYAQFKSGKREWHSDRRALEHLAERYYFDVYSVREPFIADIEDLTISKVILSPGLQNVISDIESATRKPLRLSRLKGAPVVFQLSDETYLNIGSEVFEKALPSLNFYDKSIVRSYILGLLQYQIR